MASLFAQSAAGRTGAWAHVCLLAVVAVPLTVVVVALVPVFLLGPFLSTRHHRLLLQLITGLAAWAEALMPIGSATRARRR